MKKLRLTVLLVTILAAGPVVGADPVDIQRPFVPDANTLGLWHFDESPGSAALPDGSGNVNDGTLLTGHTNELDPFKTFTAGRPGFGNCAHSWSNGPGAENRGEIKVDQYAGHNGLSVGPDSDLTIEFWFFPHTLGDTYTKAIIEKFTGGDYYVSLFQGHIGFTFWSSQGWTSVTDGHNIQLDTWTHVAVTADRTTYADTDIVTFYINGAFSSRHQPPACTSASEEPAWIMGRFDGNYERQFLGKLDELRLSNVVRTYRADPAWARDAEWDDTFYQYRIPIELDPAATGWRVLSITPAEIVGAVNQLEVIKYSAEYFDYNQIKIVEYNDSGNIVGEVAGAGFYLSTVSGELVNNGSFESVSGSLPTGWNSTAGSSFTVVSGQSHDGGKCLRVQSDVVDMNRLDQGPIAISGATFYLLSFWSRATQNTYNVSPGFTDLATGATIKTSYLPTLFSKQWTSYEALLKEETSASLRLNILRTLTGEAFLDDISLKQARIDLLIDVDSAGPKKYMIYYQPSQTARVFMPEKRIGSAPAETIAPTLIGGAQRFESRSRYVVAALAECDIWFGETTRKITPDMAPPLKSAPAVELESAINERQSFQLVLKPKTSMVLNSVALGALTSGSDTIAADKSYVKIVEYVNMAQKSDLAFNNVPRMADPLVRFTPRNLTGASDNLALWFTVIVDKNVAYGTYSGNVVFDCTTDSGPMIVNVPVKLKVHKFALPDRVTFRTSHGGSHFWRRYGGASVYDFHGVTTQADQKALVRAHYDVMCDNKVFPAIISFAVGFTSIMSYTQGIDDWPLYQWDPPPDGYNVDTPGNYFSLYNFDWSEYNAEMRNYVDGKHVNSFKVAHTNGDIINRVPLPNGVRVAYDPPDASYIEISRNQYDRLITDLYSAIAQNLIANGWIDYAYISIDETTVASGYPKIRHFCDVLAADPYASQIRIQHDIDHSAAFTWKEFPDIETDPSFRNRIDIFTPENNESYNYHEEHYYSENNLLDAQRWCYYTRSAHINIDSHGLNNRAIPIKNYFMGSVGFLDWASFIYEGPAWNLQNPWIDVYSPWGNGAVSYFYPPGDTVSLVPDLTVTPSARLEMFREGIEDFEYMVILDDWIDSAAVSGIDTSNALYLKSELARMFPHPVRWSTNDEYYLTLRNQIMAEIDRLMWLSTYGEPAADVVGVSHDGAAFKVRVQAKRVYRYNLLRTYQLSPPDWEVVDTIVVNADGLIELTDDNAVNSAKAFYKVESKAP